MEHKGSPPRSPPRPHQRPHQRPHTPPAPPVRPGPKPRTSGNPNEPEGKPASGKNLNAEYAVGGTVEHSATLRRPYNHRMIRLQSFEYGKIKPRKITDASVNISNATFFQGGYFPGAEHAEI